MQASAVLAPQSPRIVPWSRMGDEALAGRAAAGSQDAFAALYERYYGPLLGYTRSILLNDEDACDATQSALENALRALPRREPGRPLRPWLYRIAHNEAINIVRRRQPVAEGELDVESMLTVPGPEADSEQRSRLAQLVDDLRMLPERQRGALVMRELSGLSYDEIGVALNVSNEAARRAVFDARTALHDALDGRATACTSVRRTLSDGDRRRLRARGLRAHLRSCDDCASFEQAIGARQADLHALGSWLGGSAALGIIGIGGGAGGSALLAAGSGGGAAAAGGGLWAGLPVAVKGLAVAAVVATTGTAAVELPKVSAPITPATSGQAATAQTAIAPANLANRRSALEQRAQAQAATRRARAARAAANSPASLRVKPGGGSARTAVDRGATPARPIAPAPVAPPPAVAAPAPAVTTKPTGPAATPVAAKTPAQIAAENLQRIRDKIISAFANARTVANSGAQGAIATANSIIQNTLGQVMPSIQRILAALGMRLPSSTTTTAPSTTNTSISKVLAPAQSLLSGVNRLLQNLFGRR